LIICFVVKEERQQVNHWGC